MSTVKTLQLAGREISAISLDLDDTLWPIAPTMRRAEVLLHQWFEQHHPEVANAFPVPVMRALRERIWAEHPHLQHDFTETRLISLRQAMLPLGAVEADVQNAFSIFFEARNQVELFEGVVDALAKLSAVVPIISLSNGNADLRRIGIAQHFVGSVSAREFGCAKPDPAIFAAAASALNVPITRVLHIGDHAEQDMFGALRAGMIGAWINPTEEIWPHPTPEPHWRGTGLAQLCDSLLGC